MPYQLDQITENAASCCQFFTTLFPKLTLMYGIVVCLFDKLNLVDASRWKLVVEYGLDVDTCGIESEQYRLLRNRELLFHPPSFQSFDHQHLSLFPLEKTQQLQQFTLSCHLFIMYHLSHWHSLQPFPAYCALQSSLACSVIIVSQSEDRACQQQKRGFHSSRSDSPHVIRWP